MRLVIKFVNLLLFIEEVDELSETERGTKGHGEADANK